ncbi:DUF883 family protein [Bdellovibrio sp. HCB274]|uniref:DUF883 family protein n=1 Tax=Bdellovibrio sp. HCB274 TaxID=3394361 RepID=UPI0039B6584C
MAGPTTSTTPKSAASDAASMWQNGYKEVQNRARQAVDSSTDFVNEHPVSSVLGACAVGFVAGMLLRSRRW